MWRPSLKKRSFCLLWKSPTSVITSLSTPATKWFLHVREKKVVNECEVVEVGDMRQNFVPRRFYCFMSLKVWCLDMKKAHFNFFNWVCHFHAALCWTIPQFFLTKKECSRTYSFPETSFGEYFYMIIRILWPHLLYCIQIMCRAFYEQFYIHDKSQTHKLSHIRFKLEQKSWYRISQRNVSVCLWQLILYNAMVKMHCWKVYYYLWYFHCWSSDSPPKG